MAETRHSHIRDLISVTTFGIFNFAVRMELPGSDTMPFKTLGNAQHNHPKRAYITYDNVKESLAYIIHVTHILLDNRCSIFHF